MKVTASEVGYVGRFSANRRIMRAGPHNCCVGMDARSVEASKYASNGMLVAKVSFMNDIANISEKIGADIEYVRQEIGSDEHIGYHFAFSNCG